MALPLAPVERLIRQAGAERVSEDAARALANILEDAALDIAKRAVQLSKHAGRRTVSGDDIKVASR